jgi:hypothetical protein
VEVWRGIDKDLRVEGLEGWRVMAFIGFVEFLGFIGLMK